MHPTELQYNNANFDSGTYIAAYTNAREVLGVRPVSSSVLRSMEVLSRDLAGRLRDTSESLRDDRKICRRAVIDAVRANLIAEINCIIAELDEFRRRVGSSNLLDRAISAALAARVNLDTAPFQETLTHLETARALLNNLAGALRVSESVERMDLNQARMSLRFEDARSPQTRPNRQPVR